MILQIGRRIYFDKLTGNVITDTGERAGWVVETTVEQDFEAYTALSERNPETVGNIQLEYSQYAQDFATCNGYRVNPETRAIEFSYPGPEDPETPTEPVYQKPLSEQVKELDTRTADIELALAEIVSTI